LEKKATQQLQRMMNEVVEELGLKITVTSPRFRYWRVRKDKYAYGWTTEPDSQGKFYAFVYRILKDRWKLGKKVAFGRRNKAKKRAFKWYSERWNHLVSRTSELNFPT
jgi:tRNA U34 2-thiouridine synthase MnmA/TrmU